MFIFSFSDTFMQIAIAEAKAQFAELIRCAVAREAIVLPDDKFSGDEEIAEMFEKGAG